MDSEILKQSNSKFEYIFEQRRNCTCKIGDLVVFLTHYDNNWLFSHYGKIYDKEPKDIELNKINKFVITVGDLTLIEDGLTIEEFSYTLLKVHKWYKSPIKHFRLPYNKISESDYYAIINKQIFIARTAFGKIINSLHLEHRVSFIQMVVGESLQLYIRGNDYIDLFNLLKDYIESYIYPEIQMMSEIGAMIQNLSIDNNHEGLAFGRMPTENNPSFSEELVDVKVGEKLQIDRISDQVEISNNFIEKQRDINLDIILEEISLGEKEETNLSRQFYRRPLPIYLE